MNVIDRLFALRAAPQFEQLNDSELVLIAAAVRTRHYAPGEVVGAAGRPLRYLYVVVDGDLRTGEDEPVPRAFGAVSLLFGTPLKATIRAGDDGATCLMVRRAHFHTILNECPGLVVGLLRTGVQPPPAGAS